MRRCVSKTALVIAAAFCAFWATLGGSILIHFYKYDFLCYYIGGTLVRQGRLVDLYHPAAQMEVQGQVAPDVADPRPYVRPPWFAFALAPLTYLSLVHAYVVWIAVLLITLLATWAWATARFGESALVLAALFLPANLGICFGQDSAAMLAVLCGSYVLLTRKRDFASGLILGLGLMKFHLLLMFPIWMLLQKRWRMLAGFAATGAAFLISALALIGPSGIAAYVGVLVHGRTELFGGSPDTMINIYSVLANLGLESKALKPLLAAAVVAIAIYGLRRTNLWRGLAVASAASLLVSPHAFGYDATLLLLSVWLIIEFAKRKLSRYSALLIASPVIYFFTLAPQPWRAIPALALLAFLIVIATDSAELSGGTEALPDIGRKVACFAESHSLV